MQLLDQKGLSTVFTLESDSPAYVREYDGEKYICVYLTSEAAGNYIVVYVKDGYPVLAGTVEKMTNDIYDMLKD